MLRQIVILLVSRLSARRWPATLPRAHVKAECHHTDSAQRGLGHSGGQCPGLLAPYGDKQSFLGGVDKCVGMLKQGLITPNVPHILRVRRRGQFLLRFRKSML